MRCSPTTSAIVLAIAGCFSSLAVQANGAALANDKCAACHTKSGNSKDDKVPNIAGFSAFAIQDMVTSYKEGDRIGTKYTPDGGKETDMNEIAKNLSEADLKAISIYYASQTFKKQPNTTDPELVAAGAKLHDRKCEKCHSDGGANADDDAAILAGQWKAYLEKEFKDIKDGERVMPKKMMKKFKKLDEEDMKKLIDFYAAGK
jgi:cytochrome subunit of sulfide dehydrogenase